MGLSQKSDIRPFLSLPKGDSANSKRRKESYLCPKSDVRRSKLEVAYLVAACHFERSEKSVLPVVSFSRKYYKNVLSLGSCVLHLKKQILHSAKNSIQYNNIVMCLLLILPHKKQRKKTTIFLPFFPQPTSLHSVFRVKFCPKRLSVFPK